jgi:hypothetical protein
MKTLIIIFSAMLLTGFAFANNGYKKALPYSFTYVEDSTILPVMGKIEVICYFDSEYDPEILQLHYGMNGTSETAILSMENNFILPQVVPGNYVFQFFYSTQFDEIETDSIPIVPGMRTQITLRFSNSDFQRPVKKPVIYLYPETATEITVDLQAKGRLTFTYPELTDKWIFTAQTNGQLQFEGTTVPYLFWESEQMIHTDPHKILEGFIIEGTEVVAFLEQQLHAAGFNDQEKADFITFWGPQLAKNQYNLITFQWNQTCDTYAELVIQPQPANINRLYILWTAVDNPNNYTLTLQHLPVFNRDGFDVLEWGGCELYSADLSTR